jgi:hypothetical protein
VTPVVGTGTSGYNGNTDAFGLRAPGTEVQIDGPAGLAVDLDGKVVFADSGNDLIRAYVPSSGHVIDVVAGVVDDDVPKGGFNGDGHVANQTELQAPVAVTASRGALRLVADAGNRRVRQVGPVAETGLGGPEEPPEENPTSPSDDGACAIAPRPRPSESVALSVLAAAALFRLLAWRRRQS